MRRLNVNLSSKKKIKHIYIKQLKKNNYRMCAIFCGIIMLSVLAVKNVDIFNGCDKVCAHIYNPISSLYNENSSIVFASNIVKNVDKNKLKFITPIKCSEIKIEDGVISYTIDSSIMVVSPEDGVVTAVGYLPNGEKYIEISHSLGVKSRIENIYLTGVVSGQVVRKGADIATTKLNEIVTFSIYDNGQIVSNIILDKNQIIWQN
ncbi:MAG: hypothetical protein IKB42_04285 [Clostridia bacterium]|nr:hypothetical protein [Clostridia bacterium]